MKKEVWFGLTIMAGVVLAAFLLLPPLDEMQNGHLGLLMLALVVVAIMLGFPTAFTLMGMGMVFAWIAYNSQSPDLAVQQTLDLMVQRTYSVMSNDVLISIPLFVFMGYLIERANLIEKLFKSMHLATSRLPGSLAIATIITCAVFATATGIVGAVVTLMGLLALPAMLRAGYSVQLSAGAITAGGCLGILIPPSVMLIVYGATAGVSVVKLYAGAFFPGLMLASLYILYVIILAKLKPSMAPPMSEEDRRVPLPPFAQVVSANISNKVIPGLIGAIKGKRNADVPMGSLLNHLFIALLPALAVALIMGAIFMRVTAPAPVADMSGVVAMGGGFNESYETSADAGGLSEPEEEGGLQPPPSEGADAEADAAPLGSAAPAPAETPASPVEPAPAEVTPAPAGPAAPAAERLPAPTSFWIGLASCAVALGLFYAYFSFARLEIFKMLLGSFFPLAFMIMAVLGAIVFGLATPTEAAAMGSMGGLLLAAAYRRLNYVVLRESVFLTAKTTAMVCWFQYLFSGVRAVGRSRAHQRLGVGHEPDTAAIHDLGASRHILAGLAFGMDRDHRDFHADLHSLAAALRYRSFVLWLVGGVEPADRIPEPTRGHGSVLLEGREPTTRHVEPDFCRYVAVHGDSSGGDHLALHIPSHWFVAAWGALQLIETGSPAQWIPKLTALRGL
jgi:TRAP-type mannitol/chloroaromatic compound transport system permease large subunit